jgi:dTMP kinase
MFITFEGGEGTGKTTQMKRLATLLREQGKDVLCTFEPGGTLVGDALRKLMLSPDYPMDSMTELLLMMASRRELVMNVIQPALEEGKIILCDRFADASMAYQGYGRGVPLETVARLTEWVCGPAQPDLTVLFDLDPAVGLERSMKLHKGDAEAGQADRIERSGIDFLQRVREGYLDIARKNPERFIVISVTAGEEETFQQLISRLGPHPGISLDV